MSSFTYLSYPTKTNGIIYLNIISMLIDSAGGESETSGRKSKAKQFRGQAAPSTVQKLHKPPVPEKVRIWLHCFQISNELHPCSDHFQHHLTHVPSSLAEG